MFAMGDLGSGDAGMAAKGKLVKLAKAWFPPAASRTGRSGAVTTVTLAIQVAARIGGSAPWIVW